jgi:hypothetical protein
MANGDHFLDSAGNVWLANDGSIVLDDGSGNCCRRQARKCSDDSLSGLWLPVSSIPSDPYYVKRTSDGLCYYFQGSDAADPCPGHTDIGTVTGQADCTCITKYCYTKFTITWSCLNSTWSAWTAALNGCFDPATVNTSRVRTSGSSYEQYVQVAGPLSCTINGDCTTHTAATPATPTDTPTDATGVSCTPCGCSHTVPEFVDVVIAGTTSCSACFVAADNTGSAIVSAGNADGTYRLQRLPGGTCRWQESFGATFGGTNSPTLDQDCFDLDCSGNNGPLSTNVDMVVALARSAANTWRITATSFPGSATFYDSGNFAFNDQTACDKVSSGAQANTSPGCVLPTGCAPTWAAHGGTATAQFV